VLLGCSENGGHTKCKKDRGEKTAPAKAKYAQTTDRTARKRRPRVLASISQTTPMEGDLGGEENIL
jgi:hypothetical protein